jgi:hypothetical protein
MSLGKQLIERLQLGGDGAMEHAVQVTGAEGLYYSVGAWQGARRAVVEFGDHDRYSVTLRALEVGDGVASVGDTSASLHAWAAAVMQRLHYLEEPLMLWELNTVDDAAQLRSQAPQRDGDQLVYWELVLRVGEQRSARLSRYAWQPGTPDRHVVEYPATFNLLRRIADDLAVCLGE